MSHKGDIPAYLLKKMRDKYAFETGERNKFGRATFTMRSFAETPEIYLDENLSIIGFSSNFPLLSEKLPELSSRCAHISELLEEEGFLLFEKHFAKIKELNRLEIEEESGWDLMYEGPGEKDIIGKTWFCHHACGNHWEIIEQAGQRVIFHHPHLEDSVNCYLMFDEPLCRPDEDIRITYRIKTSPDEKLIRDLSLVVSGYSGREQPLSDLIGYTFCSGSNGNLEARIQRQGANLVSTMEILAPDTEYEITASRIGGKLKMEIVELRSGKVLDIIETIDTNACYDCRPHFGFMTYSAEACIYGIKVFSRKSAFNISQFQIPIEIETGIQDESHPGRAFKLRMGTDVSFGRAVHTLLFQEITREVAIGNELKARLQLEKDINEFSRLLINVKPQEIDKELDKLLAFIGEKTAAERVHLFLLSQDGESLELQNNWCKQGLNPYHSIIQIIEAEDFLPLKKLTVETNYFFYYPDEHKSPEHAKARKHFKTLGTKSMLGVSLISQNHLVGYLGIHSKIRDRQWEPELILTIETLADIISNAVMSREHIRSLEASESKFRLLAENSHDVVYKYQLKPEFKILYFSPSIETFTGYSVQECYSNDFIFEHLIHPDDLPQFENLISHPSECSELPAEKRRGLNRCIHKNGKILWAEYTYSIQINPEDSTITASGTVRDVTERKNTEVLLEESRRSLSTLLGNIKGMAYRWEISGSDGVFSYVSDGCEELTGHKASQLIGRSQQRLVKSEDLLFVKTNAEIALAAKKPFELNYRISTADGREKWVMEKGTGIYDDKGSLVAVEGFMTDITERVKAEQEIRDSKEQLELLVKERTSALRKSENDLKKKVNELSCLNRLISEFSKSSGLPATLSNITLHIKTAYFNPVDRTVVILFDGQYYSSGESIPDAGYIRSNITIDGKERGNITVYSAASTWDMPFDQNFINEISTILSAYIQRRELITENISANKIIMTGRIASEISQLINEPLSTIKNSLYIIGKSIQQDNPDHVYLSLINSEVTSISKILNNLYELYGKKHTFPDNLNEIVNRILSMLENKFKSKSIAVRTDCQEQLQIPTTKVSPLTQIIHNIIEQTISISSGGVIQIRGYWEDQNTIISIISRTSIADSSLLKQFLEKNIHSEKDMIWKGVGIGFTTARTLLESIGGVMDYSFRDEQQEIIFTIRLPLDP